MKPVKIGSLLLRQKNIILVEDEENYKRVTIRTKNQGVSLRNIEKGIEIGTKNQFLINKGQFLLSKIDARYGAFGIVPNELDGAIITGNFWAYEVDNTQLNIDWFYIYTSSPNFIKICDQASSGTTNRRYLDENKFLSHEILLPDIGEQLLLIKKYELSKNKYSKLDEEIEKQTLLLKNLRQSILQEAVLGNLVPQDTNDEPASVLFEKIKTEKEQLIKEGIIKKLKPLTKVKKGEIPYELPQGWEWVRLQDITSVITCGYASTPNYVEKGKIFLSAKNVKPYKFMPENHKFISDEDYQRLTQNAKPEVNDILLTRVGAGIGEAAIIDKELNFAIYVSLTLIKPVKNHIDSKYLLHWINSPEGVGKALNNTYGIGVSQGNLNVNQVRKYVIPLPPYSEQRRIVEKVDRMLALCENLEKSVEQSRQESKLLMQTILQEAFQFV